METRLLGISEMLRVKRLQDGDWGDTETSGGGYAEGRVHQNGHGKMYY